LDIGKGAFERLIFQPFRGLFVYNGGITMIGTATQNVVPEHAEIREVIENQRLVAYFQQIVSVSRKMVIGIEGLIRGVNAQSEDLIPPRKLFDMANGEGTTMELDRGCRSKILEEFSRIHPLDSEKLLFLNIDAAVIETSIGSGYLINQVEQYGICPRNVVIEISEKSYLSGATLKRFADTYRQLGFMVALDDVGTGFSNMDRILLVRPDIIKIDHSLVKNINNDFYKQGVFKSLVILANKIGALVVAEGVETEEEAIHVLRLGGHMIQGFYFSIPGEIEDKSNAFSNDKIEFLGKRFNKYMELQYVQERDKHKLLYKIGSNSVERLSRVPCEGLDAELRQIVSDYPAMECAYILNDSGIQISRTVCAEELSNDRKNLIFYSARKGTDHSMEKYYYPIIGGKRKRYTTEPYVSMATGNLCITISYVFATIDNVKLILCIDLKTSEDSYNIEIRSPEADRAKGEYERLLNKMSAEIVTDSLTGAQNRRFITKNLPIDILNTSNNNQPLSVILGDIDLFKNVNDCFGHLAGDQVLKEFVKISKTCIRKEKDWIARYGGDEFLIVMANANEAAAERAAEKIRALCEQTTINFEGASLTFTVSLGIYTTYSSQITGEELIGLADKNLYTAKKSGRNQAFDSSLKC